jgi:DNA-binding response OmpR family regulator
MVNGELIKQREVSLKLGDRVQIGRTFDYTFFDIAVTVEARMDTLAARTPSPPEPVIPGRSEEAPTPPAATENTPSKEGLWISPSAVIWRNGIALPTTLSRTEYRLVKFLSSRPGEVCDYESVVKAVWGDTRSKASLHELIFRVRRKLEGDATLPRHLIIRSGIGVVFFPKGEPQPATS